MGCGRANPPAMASFEEIAADYALLDEREDRWRLLIELGRALPPMPAELRTEATRVRGCSANVWVYPLAEGDRLHFLADSDAHITKGLVALILALVEGRSAREILAEDIEGRLAPFDLSAQLSSNRTQGVPNMIALIRETAARLAEQHSPC
jgi:cysteine desulfuration protein SufE